jgi:hypothetical protein
LVEVELRHRMAMQPKATALMIGNHDLTPAALAYSKRRRR